MKRTPDRDLVALARDIGERSCGIYAMLPTHLERVDEWTAGGTPSSGGEGVKGGDQSRPTESRAVRSLDRREDPFERVRRSLEIGLKAIDAALSTYEATARRLAVMDHAEAKRLAEAENITGKQCYNPHCDVWLTVSGENRSHGGRCNKCRAYRDDNINRGRPFDAERPHSVIHKQPDPDCNRCKDVAA